MTTVTIEKTTTGMKRERSKQPLCSVRVKALVALSALMFAATLSIAQEPAAPASDSGSDSDSTDAVAVNKTADATAAETAQPRAEEAPIDMTNRVSPLEYEPTESISEDNSVSFPTDI